ncbi:MAG: TonB-dependent receptor [bacterium]|nr:TonB-dependent receptor [bacterium]
MPIARRPPLNADRPRSRFSAFLLALLLTAVFGAAGRAQSPCSVLFTEAEKLYEDGNFEQVPDLLEACTKGKASRGERADACALTAKAYVMSDRIPQARLTIEALLRVDPEFAVDTRRDPSRFVRLVAEVRQASATVQVASVSKTKESLRKAPATVIVVTAEEIERRGYLDLVALFHDLPGFDISMFVGQAYANLYQRGIRTDFTNKTLFLVDGVEENDIFGSFAWISRQFPMSNIERVEIIYGPASTMYGANAFAGVVNVITKTPMDRLEEDRKIGLDVQALGGSYATRSYEGTVAGQLFAGNLSWSVTGRLFKSDEMDLSQYPEWDYDPEYFNSVSYRDLVRIDGGAGVREFESFLEANPAFDCRGRDGCFYEFLGESVLLTDEGVARAAELDGRAYLDPFNGRPVRFTNGTDDWMIQARLRSTYLDIGFDSWGREEGQAAGFTDLFSPGADNAFMWFTSQRHIYLRYARALRDDLDFIFFSRYKVHALDGPTSFTTLASSYFGGTLGLQDLVEGVPAAWQSSYWRSSNNQLRSELSMVYRPSERFTLVSGLEFRDTSVDGTWIFSPEPFPSVDETPVVDMPGGNRFKVRDVGFYAQASYHPWKDLKLVAGGRIDHNSSRKIQGLPGFTGPVGGGFGTVFNPRLAVIYSPRDYVFKIMYAEAFQAPSNFQKFMITPGIQIAAPDLEPETVENLELGASWQPSPDLFVELAAYDSRYSNIVQLKLVTCDDPSCPTENIFQNQNGGRWNVRGAMISSRYRLNDIFTFFGNYTYAEPFNTDPGNPVEQRIADIASHRLNLGGHAEFRERFDANLRLNYVGPRKRAPGAVIFPEIDAYTAVNLALGYKCKRFLHGASVQLIVNNLFDEEYFHPGVRTADGTTFAARLPQRRRNVYLRFSFPFWG